MKGRRLLSDNDENIRTLINLGLTGAQAKIFLSLLRIGQASTKEIAQVSKVARPDTYRELTELQDMGIVKKIVSIPIKFTSLSIEDAIEILMARRNQETLDLNKKTTELIERFKKLNCEPQVNDDKLILIPEEALDLELRKLLEKAEDSVCIMVSSQKMYGWACESFELIEEALKRKVSFRVVTEKLPKPASSKEINALNKNPNFEIRHISAPLGAWFTIYDGKIVVLAIGPDSAVRSNNKILIELAKDYFDSTWSSAIEPIDQIFKKDSQQFDKLFANMINGFAYCQMIFDKEGKPSDFIYLQVNDAFSKITGFEKNEIIGKKVSQAIPGIKEANPELFEIYGRVSLSRKSEEVETFFKPLNIWLFISVYSPKRGYFAALFEDISEYKKTEQKLKESELKYRNIFNNSAAGMFRTVLDGSKILDCNAHFLAIFGRSYDEVVGRPSIIHWFDPSDRQEMVRLLQAKGQIEDFECRMLTKQGEIKTCLTSLKLDSEQKILEGSIIDISERKRVENALKENQYFVEKILNTTPTLIYIYDLIEHRNVYANQEIVEFLGYEPEQIEMMGPNLFSTILHPDDFDLVTNHHSKIRNASGNDQFEVEYRMKHADESWHWLHSIDVPFSFNQEGTVKQILGSAEDITERKNNELELKRLNEVLERVGQSVDAGLAVIGKDYHVIWANQRLKDLGVAPNKKCYQIFNKSHSVCINCGVKKIFEQNRPFDVHEFKTINSKGETTWIELRVTPLKDKNGATMAALELAVPITERKKTEEDLQKSLKRERFLANLIRNASIAIAVAYPGGRLMMINEAFQRLTGYKENELKNLTWNVDLTPIEWREYETKKLGEIIQSKKSGVYEKEYIRKDGSIVSVEIVVHPFFDENENISYYFGFITDITERKKAEHELLEQKEKAERYLNVIRHVVLALDLKGNITLLNKRGCEILGYEEGELDGKNWVENCLPMDVREELRMVHENFVHIANGLPEYYENAILTKKGERKIIRWYNTVVTDESGRIIGSLSSGEDITERKKANEALETSEKKFRSLFENSLDGLIIAKRDGRILWANTAICEMLGMTKKEVLAAGRQGIVVNDKRNIAALKEHDAKDKVVAQLAFKRNDKSVFEAEISSRNFEDVDGSTSIFLTIRDLKNRFR